MASSKSHPKLKPPPRPLFSCAMFRHCTDTPLSPTTTAPIPTTTTTAPSLPPSSPPKLPTSTPPTNTHNPPTDPRPPTTSSSSSSSSSASQSFTQWRFPLHHPQPDSLSNSHFHYTPPEADPPAAGDVHDSFRLADLHFAAGNRLPALRLLERTLAANDPSPMVPCPPPVLAGIVASVLDPATARPAAKVLLAVLLLEANRRPAVDAGAAAAALMVVEGALQLPAGGSTAAERALAALELMCTAAEGTAEVRGRAGATMALCGSVERMTGRGRECAMGVLAAAYGGDSAATAPEEVGRTVAAALQGECSTRGKRKGLQLLRALRAAGRLDVDVGDVD